MDYDNLAPQPGVREFCQVKLPDGVCGAEINMMAFKRSGCCGEEHRKIKRAQEAARDQGNL